MSAHRTRASNRDRHPGEIQILADLEAAQEDPQRASKRRTAVEVAAAKKAQQSAKDAAVAAKQVALDKVARVQHKMKHADIAAMTSPATLPPKFRTKGLASSATVPQLVGTLYYTSLATSRVVSVYSLTAGPDAPFRCSRPTIVLHYAFRQRGRCL